MYASFTKKTVDDRERVFQVRVNMKKTLTSSRETHRWWWSPPPSLSRQKPNAPFLRVRMISVYRPSNTDTRAICEHGVKLIFSSLKRGGGGGAGPRCQETQRKGTKRGGGGGSGDEGGERSGVPGAGFPTGSSIKHIGGRVSVGTRPFFSDAGETACGGPAGPPSGSPAVRSARRPGRRRRTDRRRTVTPADRSGRREGGRKKLTVLYRDDIIIVFVYL